MCMFGTLHSYKKSLRHTLGKVWIVTSHESMEDLKTFWGISYLRPITAQTSTCRRSHTMHKANVEISQISHLKFIPNLICSTLLESTPSLLEKYLNIFWYKTEWLCSRRGTGTAPQWLLSSLTISFKDHLKKKTPAYKAPIWQVPRDILSFVLQNLHIKNTCE